MRYDLDWLNLSEPQRDSLVVLLERARGQLVRTLGEIRGEVTVPTRNAPELWRLSIAGGPRTSLTTTASIRLTALDEWLRKRGGEGLLATVESVGPLRFERAEKIRRDAARARAASAARELLPDEEWVDRWLTGATGDLVTAARILAHLPAAGIPLTVLAERAVGSTKALAAGSTPRLVLRGLAARFGEEVPTAPAEVRALWRQAGVAVNAVSSRALIRGVTVEPTSPAAGWINQAAELGEPFVVTLDQLLRHRITPAVDVLYVCENPAVLESARPGSAPLICTEGQPSVAVTFLVAATRAPIRWRGDFDWTGLRATATAIERYGAQPWRMDVGTYRAALADGASEAFKPRDKQADSPWDPALAAAMAAAGRAVMEERIVDTLVADLHRRE